jgi:hypothetical protein
MSSRPASHQNSNHGGLPSRPSDRTVSGSSTASVLPTKTQIQGSYIQPKPQQKMSSADLSKLIDSRGVTQNGGSGATEEELRGRSRMKQQHEAGLQTGAGSMSANAGAVQGQGQGQGQRQGTGGSTSSAGVGREHGGALGGQKRRISNNLDHKEDAGKKKSRKTGVKACVYCRRR